MSWAKGFNQLPNGATVYFLHAWQCGGDICHCRQPVIERRVKTGSYPAAQLIDRLWEGTFFTDDGDPEDWALAATEYDWATVMMGAMSLRGACALIQEFPR